MAHRNDDETERTGILAPNLDDYHRRIEEIDRLLNDPTVPMQPHLIWQMMETISDHHAENPEATCVWAY